jgi:hypothetical protein
MARFKVLLTEGQRALAMVDLAFDWRDSIRPFSGGG